MKRTRKSERWGAAGTFGGLALLAMIVMVLACCVNRCNAQTPEAQAAVVTIRADIPGRFFNGGTGVLTKRTGNTYEGMTAAHVIENERHVTVGVFGRKYRATVIAKRYDGSGVDDAVFRFTSKQPLTVVPVASVATKVGDRVWSAGYPGFANGRLVVRQGIISGRIVGGLAVNYDTSDGDSGGPLMSKHGVVGILHSGANGKSYATQHRIFGRKRGADDGGQCGPFGCKPDRGGTNPGPIIDTPTGEPEPVLLPPVIGDIADDIESIDENVDGIHSVLTEPEPAGVNWLMLGGAMAFCFVGAAAYWFVNVE